jgi:hypothetical protein
LIFHHTRASCGIDITRDPEELLQRCSSPKNDDFVIKSKQSRRINLHKQLSKNIRLSHSGAARGETERKETHSVWSLMAVR